MDRTQMSFDREQQQRLGDAAQGHEVSFAALLHRIIDEPAQQQETPQEEQPLAADPLAALIGIGEGTGKAIGRHHNRHLYEP